VSPTRHQRARRLARIALAAAVGVTTFAWLLATLDTRAPPGPPPAPSVAPSATAASAPEGAALAPEITTLADGDTFRLHVFTVPLDGARLRVVDLRMTRDLAGARARSGASLVVNAGFFDKAEQPEGLVVSEGALVSPRSDTLGGGVVAIAAGRAALFPAEGFAPQPGVDFAVQARPRLVVDGQSVIARDDGRAAERTALCLREEGRTLEIVIARGDAAGSGPTLALLADMLVSRGCQGALNLDGGPSTGAAWREPEGLKDLPPRGPVRQAIAVWVKG
jgi:hypothetical protein